MDDWVIVKHKDVLPGFVDFLLYAALFFIDWRVMFVWRTIMFYKKYKNSAYKLWCLVSWFYHR